MDGNVILGLALLAPIVILVLFAAFKMRNIRSTYGKYYSVKVGSGVTGQQAGRQMLDLAGLQAVPVEQLNADRQPWESYYDMKDKVLRLSPVVFRGSSASDLGMVAYECAQAVQYADPTRASARQRAGILYLIGTNIGLLLFVVGIVCLMASITCGVALTAVGLLIFVPTAAAALLTLPAESSTAKRAEDLLRGSGLAPDGSDVQKGAQKVIMASTWYYVGALSSIVGFWLSGLYRFTEAVEA